MNNENLIPNSSRTPNELREMGRKGGKASGRSRAIAKSLKRAYIAELEKDDGSGNNYQAVAKAIVKAAANGNVAAARELAHILGEDIVRIDTSSAIPIQLIYDGLD